MIIVKAPYIEVSCIAQWKVHGQPHNGIVIGDKILKTKGIFLIGLSGFDVLHIHRSSEDLGKGLLSYIAYGIEVYFILIKVIILCKKLYIGLRVKRKKIGQPPYLRPLLITRRKPLLAKERSLYVFLKGNIQYHEVLSIQKAFLELFVLFIKTHLHLLHFLRGERTGDHCRPKVRYLLAIYQHLTNLLAIDLYLSVGQDLKALNLSQHLLQTLVMGIGKVGNVIDNGILFDHYWRTLFKGNLLYLIYFGL